MAQRLAPSLVPGQPQDLHSTPTPTRLKTTPVRWCRSSVRRVDEAPDGPGALAVRLRGWRTAASLSQEELAAKAGMTAKAVGALERGERRRPYPHTVRALADALGLDDADRAVLAEAAAAGRAAGPSSAGPVGPVLVPSARLVGRQAVLDELVEALRSQQVRLLTLTGPGGTGKTSLAVAVAGVLSADLPGAVTVVELAAVPEARLVLPAVASALGGALSAGPAAESVATALGDRRHLLVLDNLEHVLDAAADLATLLDRCPGLSVLATSRAPLRVRAERVVALDPLPVPERDDVTAVAASPAAQVFLERAAAAGGAIALDPRTAADVAALCRRLDGLPLALELAAAHARLLSPAALLRHLDAALGTPVSRDLPSRQRTVRATLDWSHGLLTSDEQVLLRRVSVLVGSFSLEAAAAVAGDDIAVLPCLAGLVEQSLLSPQPGREPRYRALEPVRQYAAARLEDAGETALAQDRAASFFVHWAVGAGAGLRGPDQHAWLDHLAAEHVHLGSALGRLVHTGRVAEAAQLCFDTWLYWALRGDVAEGLARFEDVAAADRGLLDDRQRAGLLAALAGLRHASGDLTGMRRPAEGAVAAARAAGADEVLAEALVLAGSAALFTGDLDRARTAVEELLSVSQRAPAWAGVHAGFAHGQLLMAAGDLSSADAVLRTAEADARAVGAPFSLAIVLNMRASVALARSEDDTALRCLVEAAELAAQVGTTWTLVYTLAALGVLAARRDQPELAATLFAAGSATAEASSLAVSFPPDLASAQQGLRAARAALGDEAFARAWDAGRRSQSSDVPGLARSVSCSP